MTSSFRSGARRFTPHEPSSEPGPCAYVLGSTLGKKINRYAPKNTIPYDLIPKRSGSPPSIPARNQSHGYEVKPDGAVVAQPPAIPGYSGKYNDAVGPADYDPKLSAKYRAPRGATMKGPDRAAMDRMEAKASATPGPGYYNTSSDFDALGTGNAIHDSDFVIHLNMAKKRQLSAFESKTARDAIMQEIHRRQGEPGPGQYDIPSAIQAEKSKPLQLQCFSSSETRFRDQQPRSMQTKTAPGSYNVISSDFDQQRLRILKQKKMSSRSDWAQNIAFVSTEQRFNCKMLDNDVPPPSTYYPKVGLADTLPRSNVRSGAFGTKDERFREKKDSDARMTEQQMIEMDLNRDLQAFLQRNDGRAHRSQPSAPAYNQQQQPGSPPSKLRFSSAFAPSPDSRLRPIKTPPGPPPGAYEVTPKWIKAHGVAVMAPALNISKKKPEITPGVGQYELGDRIGGPASWRNPKNIMLSTAKREDTELKRLAVGPAPGDYNVTRTVGSFIKPSFNIYLNDKYQ